MIRQISVFVENQPGSMMEVTSVLTEAQINIRAILQCSMLRSSGSCGLW